MRSAAHLAEPTSGINLALLAVFKDRQRMRPDVDAEDYHLCSIKSDLNSPAPSANRIPVSAIRAFFNLRINNCALQIFICDGKTVGKVSGVVFMRGVIPLAREHLFLQARREMAVMALNHQNRRAHLNSQSMYVHSII